MIEIDRLTKRFGNKTAVDGLTLTVNSGECFAFLGPNGAGKTTTIKMLVGLLKQDMGAARILGHDIIKEPKVVKSLVSYVPDEPYLYDKLSGREFLEFVGRMYGMPRERAQERIADLAKKLDIGGFMDDLTEGYSHGMKQRVVIAAALLHEPKALIVDEPMVGLDPLGSRVVKDLLRDLAASGVTIFMSTHTLAIAEELANRIGVIDHGKLVAIGTLEELREASGGEKGLEDSFLRLTANEPTGRNE